MADVKEMEIDMKVRKIANNHVHPSSFRPIFASLKRRLVPAEISLKDGT